MHDKITAALQKYGRPLAPGALAKAIGTGTGPLRKHVDEMIDAGTLKATGARRGRRIGLPDMDFGAGASPTPPRPAQEAQEGEAHQAPRQEDPCRAHADRRAGAGDGALHPHRRRRAAPGDRQWRRAPDLQRRADRGDRHAAFQPLRQGLT